MILVHILLTILYIGVPLLWVLYYRTYYISDYQDKFFFSSGFLLKIFGATSGVLIYTQYYKGGDTTVYFHSAEILLKFLTENIEKSFEIYSLSDLRNYNEIKFLAFGEYSSYFSAKTTFTIVKITAIFNILTLNSFFLTSVLCSYFSFYTSWKFYKFISLNTEIDSKYIGYAVFFMPSVIFWGSGLFKDTFTLGGLYLFIIGSINILGYDKLRVRNFIYLSIGLYLLINIRSFFLLAISPFIILWIFQIRFSKIKSFSLKILGVPLLLLVIVSSILLLYNSIINTFQELSIDNLVSRSQGFQNWHTSQQGSVYSLGDIDYSLIGVISKIPASIIVTFFRPFLWEADKPIIFLSAIQSLLFLLTTLYVLFKTRIIYFFSSLWKSPISSALLGFSLYYASVVGFTSYNFGALDRYKIPCLSTYIIALIIIYNNYSSQKHKS